jgi:hypothetical protein
MNLEKEKTLSETSSSITNLNVSLSMLTSEQADSFIYAFHADTLSLIKKIKFILHLIFCPECRHYLRSYKNTIRLSLGGLSTANPIEKVPEKLIQIIINCRKNNKN